MCFVLGENFNNMNSHWTKITRILLGAIFSFSGANGLAFTLGFEPIGPTSLDDPFMQIMVNTPYIFIPLKLTELICGLLLLVNKLVPFTLIILAPICINIFMFHLFADQDLIINGIIVMSLIAFLMFQYRKNYMGIFDKY